MLGDTVLSLVGVYGKQEVLFYTLLYIFARGRSQQQQPSFTPDLLP